MMPSIMPSLVRRRSPSTRTYLPLFLAFLVLLGLPTLTRATTRTVPGQYPTIQAAINASSTLYDDTVLISSGTYTGPGNVDLDFGGRTITVTSVNGPASTIINCAGSSSVNHRGFYIHKGEIGAVISGLTIENGYESGTINSGGGIYIENINPGGISVTNCVLANNTATGTGGGIYNSCPNAFGDTISVTNCVLANNKAAGGGGGIYNSNYIGTITVTGCTLTANTASGTNGFGGGIYNSNYYIGTITVTGCTLTANIASGTNSVGGGIENSNGPGTINVTGCVLNANLAGFGGGINNYNSASSGTINVINCIISGNMASSVGGGVENDSSNGGTLTTTNCALSGNMASYGGGIYNYGNSGRISETNCTLTGNTASNGGGIDTYFNTSGGSVGVTNCTLTGNTAPINSGGSIYTVNSGPITATNDIFYGDTGGEINGARITATYCDVQGGYTGAGNINANPFFVNSPTNLHLLSGSPCLGAGTINGTPATTIDGVTRPNPPSIGAYELSSGQHISPQYVSPSGSDSNPGTQASPKLTIQSAINNTASGDTVIVEDGTYTGFGDVDLDFGGRNITVMSQNGPATTIINCAGSSSANHRGFYLHSGETSAVISGLTIENGYESNASGASGGGIDNEDVGVTVQNCVLKNNAAVETGNNPAYGGGIYNYNSISTSPMIVTNCVVTGNTATSNGGGVSMDDRSDSGMISVTNCIFTGNSSFYGGGIDIYGTGANNVTGCTFTGNTATRDGGGVYNQFNNSNHPITFADCTFTGNTAYSGGGIYNYNGGNGTITFTNCTLTGNSANGDGGGGFYTQNRNNGAVNLSNCTLSANTANYGGGLSIFNLGSGKITATNCVLISNVVKGAIDNTGTYYPGQGGGIYSGI